MWAILFVVMCGAGYFALSSYWSKRERETTHRAVTLAELLAGSITYRTDPARFVQFRDSLLTARGVSRVELLTFLARDSAAAERYYDFVTKVEMSFDSILRERLPVLPDSSDSTISTPDSAAGR